MPKTIQLENKILTAKMGSLYHSLCRSRDRKGISDEFAFAADGLIDAVDDFLDEIKPLPHKSTIERLNSRNRYLQSRAHIFLDIGESPAGPLYLRYKQACAPRYEDRPSKTHAQRYESNQLSIKALGDFIEANALHFMADHNRIMRTYHTGQSFKIEQIDRLIAVMRSHIAGVEGNVVHLPLRPRP